jgi:hypothetical protein
MFLEKFQHVIEKTDTGLHDTFARTVKIELEFNLRFSGISFKLCVSHAQ